MKMIIVIILTNVKKFFYLMNKGLEKYIVATLSEELLDKAARSIKKLNINPSFAFSAVFHAVIFALIFGSFSGKMSSSASQFIPIGLEIADFKAGSMEKRVRSKNSSKKLVEKQSINGESFVKNEESGNSEAVQKSRILKYNSYVQLIAHELERRKSRFNMDNAPEDMKVTVVFEVNLDESGKMTSYKVVKNSGNKFFDNVAERIITANNNFPAPPAEIKSMGLKFSIPIIFDSLA